MAFSVGEDGSLWNVHFAGDFAEVNPGCVRGLYLFPNFVRDLSAHKGLDNGINASSLVQFKSFGSVDHDAAFWQLVPLYRIALESFLIAGWLMIRR